MGKIFKLPWAKVIVVDPRLAKDSLVRQPAICRHTAGRTFQTDNVETCFERGGREFEAF
jgi:hypothetical protein